MTDNLPNEIPSEILQETLRLVHEMLKDPEIAEKAISDRNVLIKGLKADIEHRKAAYKEVASRYTELLEKIEQIEQIQNNTKALEEENKKIKVELETAKLHLNDCFGYRVDQTLKKVPGVIGTLLRFFFTGPVAKYSFLVLFCMLVIASITGWGFVAAALHPIAKLIGTIFGFGD
jgi:chromosome segregation ATPase